MTHPARAIPFRELVAGLAAANDNGHVNVQEDGALRMYTYSKSAVYDKVWTPFTEMARGLILDHANENVVATPFVKFWNYGERPEIPNLPFEVFEKVDGSLIVIWHHNGRWRCSTKGSFNSDQAVAAQRLLERSNTDVLVKGSTYLAEYVGPSNRIVIQYADHELVLLGAYWADGKEYTAGACAGVAAMLGWRVADRHHYSSFADLLAHAPTLPATQEGFVVRFANGYRLKIKGDEYCRLHRCISNVTPLAIWDAMQSGADLDAMRRELPEEFWADFDFIRHALNVRLANLRNDIADYVHMHADKSDKELGLVLHTVPAHVRSYLFPYRKHGSLQGRAWQNLYRQVRPTGNVLEGYRPSSAMLRLETE